MDSKMMFPLSAEFKMAMGVWAEAHHTSIADLIRTAVAAKIGYELEPVGQHTKYASPAERIAAQAARNAERKAIEKLAMAEYKKNHAK